MIPTVYAIYLYKCFQRNIQNLHLILPRHWSALTFKDLQVNQWKGDDGRIAALEEV